MNENIDTILYKLRLPVIGSLVLICLLLLGVLVSSVSAGSSANSARPARNEQPSLSDNPNVVAGGMGLMATEFVHAVYSTDAAVASGAAQLGRTADGAGEAISRNSTAIAGGVARSSTAVASAVSSSAAAIGSGVATGISTGISRAARVTASGLVFVVQAPGEIAQAVTDTPVVSAVIKPPTGDAVPTIQPPSTALAVGGAMKPVGQSAMSPTEPAKPVASAAQSVNSDAAWPLHGEITTLFGVVHWPYQPIHTGIDISDGQRPGVTSVKPFKSGQVVEAVRSYRGLGHYVTVDHGSGLTSVYAHLNSIGVQVGQNVDGGTILGYEGTTGSSTGTHLHFEIRVNGQPVNPMSYISGRP